MNADVDWSHIVSIALGSSGATFVFRLLAKRAIDQLDEITKRLETVSLKLVVVENELLSLKLLRDAVNDHDRRLIAIEIKMANSTKEK